MLFTNSQAYFLGLSGDKDGSEGRVGICNTNLNLLKKTRDILISEFAQPKEKVSLIVQYNNEPPEEIISYFIAQLDINQDRRYKYKIKDQKGKLVFKLFVKDAPLWRRFNLLEMQKYALLEEDEKTRYSYIAGKIDAEGHIDLICKRISLRYYNLEEAEFDKELIESLGLKVKIIPNSRKKFDGWHLLICHLSSDRSLLYSFCKEIIALMSHDAKVVQLKKLMLKLEELGIGASG